MRHTLAGGREITYRASLLSPTDSVAGLDL